MDLSQAEAVADLIASDSESSHKIALQQMRGGFSNKIKELRDELRFCFINRTRTRFFW